jgi:hypothetical protein
MSDPQKIRAASYDDHLSVQILGLLECRSQHHVRTESVKRYSPFPRKRDFSAGDARPETAPESQMPHSRDQPAEI